MTDDLTHEYDNNPAPTPDPEVGNDPTMNDEAPAASETAAAWAAAGVPVAAAGGAGGAAAGASKGRWFVAIGVAVVAIALAVGAFLLLNGRSTPEALTYVPGDAAAVIEVRPDLPGDQMELAGKFIAHFPGFADLSTIDQKLDDGLTRLLKGSATGGVDYVTQIKPWFNGPMYIAIRKGDPASTSVAMPFGVLISATTNGQATCAAIFKDQTTATETYQGTELVFVNGSDFGCAVKERQGLLGDRASLKAALDAKSAGNGIVGSAKYKAATAALTGDHLATFFYDFDAYFALLKDMAKDLPTSSAMPFSFDNLSLPPWGILGLRSEGDAIVMDSKTPVAAASTSGPTFLPLPAAHKSEIVGMVPADAVAFVEGQGAGVSIQNLITQLRTIPEVDAQLKTLDGVASMSSLVGWVQDAGVVVTGGDAPTASVILMAADEAAASEKAGSFGTVIGLLQLQAPGSVTTHDETVNGVKITTITITDLGALTGGAGITAPTGPVELSYAVKGKAIIFGVGTGAVAKVINVQSGASLADDAAFKRVAARGVSPSVATVYISIPKLLDLVETAIPANELATFNTDVKPYLEPLEAIYYVNEADGDLAESTAILSVKPN